MTDSVKLPKALTHEVTFKNIKPCAWWLSMERCEVISKKFCELAVRLTKMPSNSAAIERMFSVSLV